MAQICKIKISRSRFHMGVLSFRFPFKSHSNSVPHVFFALCPRFRFSLSCLCGCFSPCRMEAELSRAADILAKATKDAEERQQKAASREEDPTPKIVEKEQTENSASNTTRRDDEGRRATGSDSAKTAHEAKSRSDVPAAGAAGNGALAEDTWMELLADRRFFEDHANYLQLVAFSSSAKDQRVW